jgi:hypothetical protein
MNARRTMGTLALFGCLFLATAQDRAHATGPPDVPDLSDPAVLNQFVPVGLSPFAGDPDFPMLLLANRERETPQLLLAILDARNGKETWSLRSDAPVFYLLLADPATIQRAFLDHGFAVRGEPSGEFIATGPDGAEELMARLQEGYLRCRGLSSPGAIL